MTTAEKNALKAEVLQDCVASLRHIVRHNGAELSAKADITEVAEHCTEISIDRVQTMWTDINTIDRLKNILRDWPRALTGAQKQGRYFGTAPWLRRPEGLSADEVAALPTNDEAQVAAQKSWAVLRITKSGTEILTCGGDYYQSFKGTTTTEPVIDPETGVQATDEGGTPLTQEVTTVQQEGDTDLLRTVLEAEDAAWMAETWSAVLDGTQGSYTEGGIEFIQVPCELPGNLDQLISISIQRTAADGSAMPDLDYSLTENSCDVSNAGMVALPHGLWLIYDNSHLESAPKALLVPKDLTDNTDVRITGIEIVYNALVSGLARLRLVGSSFGAEYIINTQEFTVAQGGTWLE